jgi:hypothetical protein
MSELIPIYCPLSEVVLTPAQCQHIELFLAAYYGTSTLIQRHIGNGADDVIPPYCQENCQHGCELLHHPQLTHMELYESIVAAAETYCAWHAQNVTDSN